jgi:hypothetical protein
LCSFAAARRLSRARRLCATPVRGKLDHCAVGAANCACHALDVKPAHGLLRIGTAAATVLVVAQTAAHLLDFGVWQLRVQALDADAAGGVFPWISTGVLGAGAVAAALQRERRAGFTALAAILALLAVHMELDLRAAVPHWSAAYVPLLAVAAYLIWTLPIGAEGARAVARCGLVVLAFSLVVHLLGPPLLARLGWGPDDWAYQVKVVVKQGSELGGWTLVAAALLSGARVRRRGVPIPART